jgi:hypothetical protein
MTKLIDAFAAETELRDGAFAPGWPTAACDVGVILPAGLLSAYSITRRSKQRET